MIIFWKGWGLKRIKNAFKSLLSLKIKYVYFFPTDSVYRCVSYIGTPLPPTTPSICTLCFGEFNGMCFSFTLNCDFWNAIKEFSIGNGECYSWIRLMYKCFCLYAQVFWDEKKDTLFYHRKTHRNQLEETRKN